MTLDPRAATGFANAADAYERGRPSFPAEAVARVARELGVTSSSRVLDLAAGTGKLTRLLAGLAGHVVAVEPSHAMLAKLREQLPAVEALDGTAEAIPLPDGAVDAVFVGDAFHWFRPDEAAREIARVLTPRGGLALLWNRAVWSAEELPWLPRFDARVMPHREAAGAFPSGGDEWRHAIDQTGLFRPLESAEAEHVQRLGPEDFVAMVSSWSWIANLPGDERARVLDDVRRIVGDERPALRYRAELYWTRVR